MGKRTVTIYECDRCDKEVDGFVLGTEKNMGKWQLSAIVDYGVAGGNELIWHDLCPDCNRHLMALVRREQKILRETN